jgi:CRISPR-associated protein Cas1
MLKKVLALSRAFHLSTRLGQLVFTDKETQQTHQRPLEDLGCLLVENPQTTLTTALLQGLAAHNVAVVFCDDQHLPASVLYHLDTHYVQTERLRQQLAATGPLRKQLWQQTVRAKILNQAAALAQTSGAAPTVAKLRRLAAQVRSGDSDNLEAQAAQAYWPALLGESFRREREGPPPNPSLNYGYALLRAAAARALAASGLLPALGLHHHNRYNPFCLADDLMEPYRPWVDRTVWRLREARPDYHVLHPENKRELLGILHQDTAFAEADSPLMVALGRSAQSLARAYAQGGKARLAYPTLPVAQATLPRPYPGHHEEAA